MAAIWKRHGGGFHLVLTNHFVTDKKKFFICVAQVTVMSLVPFSVEQPVLDRFRLREQFLAYSILPLTLLIPKKTLHTNNKNYSTSLTIHIHNSRYLIKKTQFRINWINKKTIYNVSVHQTFNLSFTRTHIRKSVCGKFIVDGNSFKYI